MRLLLFFILAFAVIVSGSTFIDNELNHIDTYEVVSITHQFNSNPSTSTKRIEFTAFNQLYSIELTPNRDIVASRIRHSNGNPTIQHNLDQYFTHLTTPCHYFGTVLNTKHTSQVALSICDKRGVRGSITAFNDTLIIKPSRYYLDIPYDRTHYHHISDPHLVYKLSDYHAPRPSLHDDTIKTHHTVHKQSRQLLDITFDPYTHNQVEMFILSDPIFTSYYVSKYPMNWYDQLVSYFADQIHSVSAEYINTDWGRTIGTINITLVEVEVVHAYTGDYASLTPSAYDQDCADIQQFDAYCTADSSKYLASFAEYITTYKNTSTFDNAQLWTKMALSLDRDGLSFDSSVCQGASSSAIISSHFVGDIGAITVSAHQLGHCFGMSDDGLEDSDCTAHEGIMGDRPNGFSSCSITDVQAYFAQQISCTSTASWCKAQMQCLVNGVHLKQDLPTPIPDTKTTSSGSSSDWDCVTIQNMGDAAFNGDWLQIGTYVPHAYKLDGNQTYLYYIEGVTNYWLISTELMSEDWPTILAYCTATRLIDCSSTWIRRIPSGREWIEDTNAYVSDCASSINTSTSVTSTTETPLDTDWCTRAMNGESVDEYWLRTKNGMTYSGRMVYELVKENVTYYLYYSMAHQEWDISTVQPSEKRSGILAYCRVDHSVVNVKDCPGPWRSMKSSMKSVFHIYGTFAECDPSCVHLQEMDSIILNGEWTQLYEGQLVSGYRKVYSMNGLYLFYALERQQWIISRDSSLTADGSVMWAYCGQQNLFECANQWFIFEPLGMRQDTGSLVTTCASTDKDTACTAKSYDCVGISGLLYDEFNGLWYSKGCHHGKTYYQMKSRNDTYLCHNDFMKQWILTSELCTVPGHALCPQDDIMDCDALWFLDDGTKLVRDRDSVMVECSDYIYPETTIDDYYFGDECPGQNDYDHNLCVFSNGSVWNGGYREFGLSEWLCLDNKAVYFHEVSDVADILAGLQTYYIYFEPYEDGKTGDGDWVIAQNKVRTGTITAKCSNANLTACVEGQWSTLIVEEDDDDGGYYQYYNYYYNMSRPPSSAPTGNEDAFVVNEKIHVLSGRCGGYKEKKELSTGLIAAVLVCCIVIVCAVVFVYVKKKKKKRFDKKKIQLGKSIKRASMDIVYDDDSDLDPDGPELPLGRSVMPEDRTAEGMKMVRLQSVFSIGKS